MLRAIAVLVFPIVALAQSPFFQRDSGPAQQDPCQTAFNAFWSAQSEGRYEDGVRFREEARRLLTKVEPDAPQFATSATQVAQLYSSAAMTIEARAILDGALGRIRAASPARVVLLTALADAWEEDRNLLKALVYREKAAAAQEAIQAAPPGGPVPQFTEARVFANRVGSFRYAGDASNGTFQRLADLYRKLGRPEDAAKVRAKIRELAKGDDNRLAALAEQEGRTDDAAALYKKLAEQSAGKAQSDIWQALGPLQSLARVYQQERRYADAVAVLRRAITVVEGRPETGGQNVNLRQQLAAALKQLGQVEAAEQVHLQAIALAPPAQRWQALTAYANFLGETGRGEQGLQLLQDSLARGGPAQEWEESSARFMLSQLARQSGNTKLAEEYQKAAITKQPRQQESLERITLHSFMQRANAAASSKLPDEAFAIALEAMNAAGRAADRESIVGLVWSIANGLAASAPSDSKAAERGRQLFDRLFVLVDGWSDQTRRPQIEARERYFQFVRGPFRGGKMGEDAIARYREVLIAARGEGTGWMEQVLQLKLQLSELEDKGRHVAAARELVELEEALSGATSEPYLRAVQTLATAYATAEDLSNALRMRMQAVAIADLISEPGDSRRGYVRNEAAATLARLKRFDEAEKLVGDAMAIELRPPQPGLFQSQMDQIRQMREVAEKPRD